MKRSPRLFAFLAGGVGLALVLVGVLVLRERSEVEPLDAGSVGDLTQPLDLGQTFADADVVMFNRSDEPLTLERVQAIAKGPDVPEFRFLAAGSNRTDDVQGGTDLQCPPSFFKPASMKPIRGFVLPPRSTPEGKVGGVLITCFQAPIYPGRFQITHLKITYTIDGDRRTITIPRSLAVCSAPDARCDPAPDASAGT